jgi:hypothetical protein
MSYILNYIHWIPKQLGSMESRYLTALQRLSVIHKITIELGWKLWLTFVLIWSMQFIGKQPHKNITFMKSSSSPFQVVLGVTWLQSPTFFSYTSNLACFRSWAQCLRLSSLFSLFTFVVRSWSHRDPSQVVSSLDKTSSLYDISPFVWPPCEICNLVMLHCLAGLPFIHRVNSLGTVKRGAGPICNCWMAKVAATWRSGV